MPNKKVNKNVTPICSELPYTKFNGTDFFKKYSESKFLKSSKGKKFVLKVLSSSIQFKVQLKEENSITLNGIKLDDKEDLIVKKGSENQAIGDFDFTLKRLQGFCAAYACANVDRFDENTIVAIAASLGYELTDNNSPDFRKFYFSFAPGSEHFSCVFEFWPLVATLVQMTLKKHEILIKKALPKFKVKGDDKKKLIEHLKNKDVIARISPVVESKVAGEAICIGDCLIAFTMCINK